MCNANGEDRIERMMLAFLLPLIIVDAFHIECILYGNLANNTSDLLISPRLSAV